MSNVAPEIVSRINESFTMRWYFGRHGQDYPNDFSTDREYDEAGRAAYDLRSGDMMFIEGAGAGGEQIDVTPEERAWCRLAALEDIERRTNTFRYAIHIALARGADVRYADATLREWEFVSSVIKDQADQIPVEEYRHHWGRWLLFRDMMREESAYTQMLTHAQEHLSAHSDYPSRPQLSLLWGRVGHFERMRERAAADGLDVQIINLEGSTEAERSKERTAYIGRSSTRNAE